MRVACITHHRYPTEQEIRVTKLAMSLRGEGHDVIVYCPGNRADTSNDSFIHGEIRRLHARGWIGRALLVPLPINPVWLFWLAFRFQKDRIGLVIVRDLRLFVPAFFASRLCRLPILLDIGEHYPGMMAILGRQHFTHHLIRNRRLITWLEAWSVRLADAVLVVVEENRQRLSPFNRRIEVIGNYPPSLAFHCPSQSKSRIYSTDGPPVRVISLGLIDSIRGLDLAIDAFTLLVRELPNVRLVIYGDGPFRQALETRVAAAGLKKVITFGGWVSTEQKYHVLTEGDIGLLLHKVCELTQHTQPNKLFDYMSVGIPVLSTRLRPVVRVLEAEHCGIAVDESPLAVASGLKGLILDHEGRYRMGQNGRNACEHGYHWEDEAAKFLSCIREFLNKASA